MNAMFDYRTVYIPAAMPPAQERKAGPSFEEQMLAADLAADAARCNQRLNRTWDEPGPGSNGAKSNAIRMEAAAKRDEAMTPVILALLSAASLSREEIQTATGLSREVAKRILQTMREDGRIIYNIYGRNWSAA